MSLFARTRPSPAMVVGCVALSFALAGSAVAGTEAVTSTLDNKEKRQVKKIAKKQANKQIKKRAPGLSVANAQNATNAQNASTANFANSANPLGFAHVAAGGAVTPSLSHQVTSANVTHPAPGTYCFSGLPFTPHTVHGTVDIADGPGTVEASTQPANFLFGCPPSAQVELVTFETDTITFRDFGGGFYVTFH